MNRVLPNIKYGTAVLEDNSCTEGALSSAQYVVGPLDPNTISRSFLYSSTVADCSEDSGSP